MYSLYLSSISVIQSSESSRIGCTHSWHISCDRLTRLKRLKLDSIISNWRPPFPPCTVHVFMFTDVFRCLHGFSLFPFLFSIPDSWHFSTSFSMLIKSSQKQVWHNFWPHFLRCTWIQHSIDVYNSLVLIRSRKKLSKKWPMFCFEVENQNFRISFTFSIVQLFNSLDSCTVYIYEIHPSIHNINACTLTK